MLLDGIWHDGVHAFAGEYLGDAARPVPFGGRDAELAALEAFAHGDEPFAILCAGAGRGKSALALHLARRLDAVGEAVAWIPLSLRFGTSRSATAEPLLTARVRALMRRTGHWADLLGGGNGDAGKRLLVVLDGLDELSDDDLLDALARFIPGPHVRLLVTARQTFDRDASAWARRLGWRLHEVHTLSPLGLGDVAQLVRTEAPEASATDVMLRSGGDPLLVRLCIEALRDGLALPESEDPLSLVGAWWEAQRRSLAGAAGALSGRALTAVGVACGVIPWTVLSEVLEVPEDVVRSALAPFERFLVDVPGEGVAFSHPRFADVACAREEATSLRGRFAVCARDARLHEMPDRYWLQFAGAHFATAGLAGQDLEAWDTLTTFGALEAWRRLEGGLTGFLSDLRSAWGQVDLAVERAWGTPGAVPLLHRQARLQTLEAALTTAELAMEPELRSALVAHGVRSARSALASIAELAPGDRFESVRSLLPVLPDALLPSLLALDCSSRWPRADVVKRLVVAGAAIDAVFHLRKGPRYLAETLVEIAPALSSTDVEVCRAAILQANDPQKLEDGEEEASEQDLATPLEQRLILLRLVPSDAAPAELDAIAAEVKRLSPRAFFYDGYYGETDLRSGIAEAYARQGRAKEALAWLDVIRKNPVPWEPGPWSARRNNGYWLDEIIRVNASVAVDPEVRRPVLKWLATAPEKGKLSVGGWIRLTAVLPEPAFLEAAWTEADRYVRYSLSTLFSATDAHPLLLERAARSLIERAERALAARETGSGKAAKEASIELEDIATALTGRPHPDAGRLLALAYRWHAVLPAPGTTHAFSFTRFLTLNATSEARRAVVAPLLVSLAEAGVSLLALSGWEAVVPFETRRSILVRRAASPVTLPLASQWVTRLTESAKEIRKAGVPEAVEVLREAATRCAGENGELLVACAEIADDSTQAVLAERILAGIGPNDHGESWAFESQVATLSALTAVLRDGSLRTRVAREAIARVPDGRWPNRIDWWKPVFAALPPDEVEGAHQRLAGEDGEAWDIDEAVALPIRRKAFVAREKALRRKKAKLGEYAELWWGSFSVPEGEAFRAGIRSHLQKKLPRLPGESSGYYPQHDGWLALGFVVQSSDPKELLFIQRFLDRAPLSTVQDVGRRAADLVRPGAPEAEALLVLAQECSERTKEQHLGYHLMFDVARAEARFRALDGDAALAFILERAGAPESDGWWSAWLAEVCLAEGWAAAHARYVRSLPGAADRLRAWAAIWSGISATERDALRPEVVAAARNTGSSRDWASFSSILPADVVRTLWARDAGRTTPGYWFPAETLLQFAGSGGVTAWASGISEALSTFASAKNEESATGQDAPGEGG